MAAAWKLRVLRRSGTGNASTRAMGRRQRGRPQLPSLSLHARSRVRRAGRVVNENGACNGGGGGVMLAGASAAVDATEVRREEDKEENASMGETLRSTRWTGGRVAVVVMATSAAAIAIGLGLGECMAHARGIDAVNDVASIAEGEDFWTNVLRYITFFITIVTGFITFAVKQVIGLMKTPVRSVAVVSALVLFTALLVTVLRSMLGVGGEAIF